MSSILEPFNLFSEKVFLETKREKRDAGKVSCSNFEGFLSLLSGLAEAIIVKEVTALLWAPLTIQLKTCPPYKRISWKKKEEGPYTPFSNAEVNFTETCHLQIPHRDFANSLNVSKDCRELHFSHVEKEDAGRYTAHIVSQNKNVVEESFDVSVSSKYPSHVREFLASFLCPG